MLTRRKQSPAQVAVNRFAIDPGAFRTRFYSATQGLLLDQPSIAALDMDHPLGGSSAIDTFGDQAVELLASGAEHLKAIHPVQSDQHNDLGFSTKMLDFFLTRARRAGLIERAPEITLLLPHGCANEKRDRLMQVCSAAGASNVEIQNAALAAFYGTGLDQTQPYILIDFGATGSRLIAVVDGQVAYHQHLSCGGDAIDQAITAGLLEKFELHVSDESAREVKHTIGAATPQSFVQCTRSSCQITCLSVRTGARSRFRIGSETVNDLLQPLLAELTDSIRSAFGAIDSQTKEAAYETGIRLCGGGALLARMDQLVMSATDLPVEVVNRPLTCSVRGAALQLLDEQPMLELEELL